MNTLAQRVVDGQVLAYLATDGIATDPVAWLVALGYEPPPIAIDPSRPRLYARINRGVWIASCACGRGGLPRPGGVVFYAYPFVWCPSCSTWSAVEIPADAEQLAEVVGLRRREEDRNTDERTTLLAEIADNIAHGDPVPDWAEGL